MQIPLCIPQNLVRLTGSLWRAPNAAAMTRKGTSEGERGKNTCQRRTKRRLLSRFLAQAS